MSGLLLICHAERKRSNSIEQYKKFYPKLINKLSYKIYLDNISFLLYKTIMRLDNLIKK